MKFKLKPVLAEMKELYQGPVSTDRFKNYISKLQGDSKNDLALPIAGFNPMAKDHILKKIEELENLDAEGIIENTITSFNQKSTRTSVDEFMVVLNLADDMKGAWTNFYTTDFDSKFKLNAFVTRKFCTPYFWTSETYTEDLITIRTSAYLNRTIYWLNKPKPITLEDHLNQEIFVSSQAPYDSESIIQEDFQEIQSFYNAHKQSQEYDLIFNFFYGNVASESLGYKTHGIKSQTGFHFAEFLASKQV